MAFLDYLKSAVQGGEHALGINTPGHGAVYNAVQGAIQKTNQRPQVLNPVNTWLNKHIPNDNQAMSWINNGASVPNLPNYQLPQASPQFIKQHPIVGSAAQAARFLGELPGQFATGTVNSIVPELANTVVDTGKIIGKGLSGQPLPQYNQLKSHTIKLAPELASLVRPERKQQYGVNTTPSEGVRNVAGAALPIINLALLNAGVKTTPGGSFVSPAARATLFKNAVATGNFTGKLNAVTGGLQGLVDYQGNKLGSQSLQGLKQAAIGYATGFPLGFGGVYGGASVKVGLNKLANKKVPGFVNFDPNAPGGGYDPTKNTARGSQATLEQYVNKGDFQGAANALKQLAPEDAQAQLETLPPAIQNAVKQATQSVRTLAPFTSERQSILDIQQALDSGKPEVAQALLDDIPQGTEVRGKLDQLFRDPITKSLAVPNAMPKEGISTAHGTDTAQGIKDQMKSRMLQGSADFSAPLKDEPVPTYKKASDEIASLGGFAKIDKMPLPQKNAYAANELANTLGLNKEFLYQNATKNGVDLTETLAQLDKSLAKGGKIEDFPNAVIESVVNPGTKSKLFTQLPGAADFSAPLGDAQPQDNLTPLIQEAKKYNNAQEFTRKIANEAGVSDNAKVKSIPLNKITGTDYNELDQALAKGDKLSVRQANELIRRVEDPITKGRSIITPIDVVPNPDGTYSLHGGNNRVAQALVNGQSDILATSNRFKDGLSFSDIYNKLDNTPITPAEQQAIEHQGEKIKLTNDPTQKNVLGQPYESMQEATPQTMAGEGVQPNTFEEMSNRAEAAKKATDTGIATPQTLKDSLNEMFAKQQEITKRSQALQYVLSKAEKTPQDTEIFRQVTENPSLTNKLIAQASDPQAMFEAVAQHRDFTKYLYDVNKSVGVDLGFRPNYYHHAIDLSNPEDAARYQQLVQQKYGKNYVGGYTKPAVFDTVNQIRAAGFKLKNPTALQDIQDLTGANRMRVGNEALFQAIDQAFPGQITKGASPLTNDPATRNMIKLRVPGMEGTYVTPQVFASLKHLEPSAFADNGVVKILDSANANLKSIGFLGGGFHGLKASFRFPAAALAEGEAPNTLRAVYSFLSPSYRNAELQSAISDGVVDFGSNAGITYSSGSDITPRGVNLGDQAKSGVQKFENSIFSGLIDNYKLQVTRGMMKHYDLSDPAQLADARAVGQQVNNLFGGLNRVTGDTYLKDPTARQAARLITLAPDFTEGKVRTLLGAVDLRKGTSAAGRHLAQAGLVGEALVSGFVAEMARKVLTGKYSPTLKDIIKNDVLDPSFPVPKTVFNTANNSRQQVVGIPGSTFADISRGISDPKHFIEARGASLLNTINSRWNNQDYYGRQIFNPNDSEVKKDLKVLQTKLPIPAVQGLKTLQGKETPAAALVNTIGGRVHTDPNDPSIQILQQRTNFRSTLDQADQAQWDSLHPPTTDAAGNTLLDPNAQFKQGPLYSAQKADIYLNHPEFLAQDTKIAQTAGGNQDPFFTILTPGQQQSVLLLSSGKALTIQESQAIKNADWYKQFTQTRDAFYNSLPQVTNTGATPAQGTALDAFNAQRNALGLPDIPPTQPKTKKPPSALHGATIPKLKVSKGRKAKTPKAATFRIVRPTLLKTTPTKVVTAPRPKVAKLRVMRPPRAVALSGKSSIRRGYA